MLDNILTGGLCLLWLVAAKFDPAMSCSPHILRQL